MERPAGPGATCERCAAPGLDGLTRRFYQRFYGADLRADPSDGIRDQLQEIAGLVDRMTDEGHPEGVIHPGDVPSDGDRRPIWTLSGAEKGS